MLVPLPHEVHCVFTMKTRDAQPISPRFSGQLEEVTVKPGDAVHKGDVLARIKNVDLEITLASLEADEKRYEAKLQAMLDVQIGDPSAGAERKEMEELLKSTRKEVEELRDEFSHQLVTSPVDGIVIAPEYRAPRNEKGRLPSWSGSPLDVRNVGATVAESDLLCRVGDPQHKVAELIIDQSVVDYIQPGQRVSLKFDGFPHQTFRGQIEKIADEKLQVVPPSLTKIGGGGMEVVTDPSTGAVRPQNPSYPASVIMDDPSQRFQLGMKGQARVSAAWIPLGMRLYRYLAKTVRFEL
jgi:putative peptide zinc metalloprotease protein